jgi:hypothetical protein
VALRAILPPMSKGSTATLSSLARAFAVRSSTRGGMVALLLLGLLLRLVLAPHGGMRLDLEHYQNWERMLATRSWGDFQDPTTFIYYPYLYILFALGQVHRFLLGAPPSFTALKLPAILADIGLALVAAELAHRVTPRDGLPIRGPIAAALLFNPLVFFLSAVWGQLESIAAFLVLSAVLLFVTGRGLAREALAIFLLAVAMGIKPQVGEIAPILAFFVVVRHLPSDRRHSPGAWGAAALRLAAFAVLGLALLAVMPMPFGPDPLAVLPHYTHNPSYGFISLDAFNLWGLKGFWAPDASGDGVYLVGGIPAVFIGLGLYALGAYVLLYLAGRALKAGASDAQVLVFGCAAFTCLAFAVLTREHERFLYLAVPSLTALAALRPFRRALVAVSALSLVNIYYVYVFFFELTGGSTPIKIGPLYSLLYGPSQSVLDISQSSPQIRIWSLVTAVVVLGVAGLGWAWLTPGWKGAGAWLGAVRRRRAATPA